MTTAFVLSGGCNLGSVQAGMLQALFRARGREADITQLADLWRAMRRTDVFPTQLLGVSGSTYVGFSEGSAARRSEACPELCCAVKACMGQPAWLDRFRASMARSARSSAFSAEVDSCSDA